jgi:high affinity Mn2+ porin
VRGVHLRSFALVTNSVARRLRRWVLAATPWLLVAPRVHATETVPDATPASTPSGDLDHWLAGFQATYVYQHKPAFFAAYTGPKSLLPTAETGYTLTSTLFVGFRPWRNTELYFDPETIQSRELSGLAGLGGLSNSENQRGGGPLPKLYVARAFLRQTVDLARPTSIVPAGQTQFAGTRADRRLVITAGDMSLLDVFDIVTYAHDGRTMFSNWALLTHGAWDYAADIRGYTWGAVVELYWDSWAFRLGRFAVPKQSNGLALDFNLLDHHGDNLEVQHDHRLFGRTGTVRVLGFRNEAKMGSFRDAIALARLHGGPPSVAAVRRDQAKYGVGIALEQTVVEDVGVFVRASWSDGQTETYSFTEIERSLTIGASIRGRRWRRPDDTLGLAVVRSGLSEAHRDYLALGGVGFFIGDGRLNYRPELIEEAYYSARVLRELWLTGDVQRIAHPAYNADRGPVAIYTFRAHTEF